jgi:hypothetical protein
MEAIIVTTARNSFSKAYHLFFSFPRSTVAIPFESFKYIIDIAISTRYTTIPTSFE